MMFSKGYNENDIVNLVRIFPPTELRIVETLTVSAIKAIYSICYESYHFRYYIYLKICIKLFLREITKKIPNNPD